MKNNRKIGIIEISRQISYKNIDLIQDIWKCVTPLHSLYDNTRYQLPVDKFICYCDKFEEVKEGVVTPEYILTIKRDENNEVIDFSVEKRDWNKIQSQPINEEQL